MKSTETSRGFLMRGDGLLNFSNFGSLKSTETPARKCTNRAFLDFSNFGSLKSTETRDVAKVIESLVLFQQFRLVEEH